VKRVLAIDVGGTKLATAIVTADGAISAERRTATPRTSDPEELFTIVADLARESLAVAGVHVDGIGVGCGGPMRWPAGVVSPLHIPAWRDFPLRERLAALFAVSCAIDNDAKAFALGEHWLGAGRGARALLGIVVSTGVGAGIVIDGQLVHGASGQAGHLGHVVADPDGPPCECGARGCVEAIASGSAIARRGGAEPAEIAVKARAGNADASRIYVDAGGALARGIASAAALLDLDRVVIGGGVTLGAWDLLEPALVAELALRARLSFTRDLKVVPGVLGARAGLIGAAKLALDG
jgi:glucokinase